MISSQKIENRNESSGRILKAVLPLFIYFILSFIFFGSTGSLVHQIPAESADVFLFVWFIHWWPFAIVHGLNPFVSNYVWFPHGVNLTWATSVPSAALLCLPVTLLGGAVLSYNLLTLLAPALSAWTSFLLARYLTRDWAAAFVSGYLFGFSSYELGQIRGHLNLNLTFLVPLVVLLCVRRTRGELGRAYFIAILAFIFLIELGLSSEILATLCVLGAIVWAVFLACAPTEDRSSLWRLAFEIVFASMAMTILASPFLFYLVHGLPDVPPSINSVTDYSADSLNYAIPTIITRFGRSVFAPLANQFTGNGSEQGAYLGLPLLFLMALYFRDQMALPYVRALLITMIVLVVLSFGPWLHIDGVQTHIPLPWWLGEKLPLIGSALPARFTMYTSLVSAITAALYLSAPSTRHQAQWRFALAGLACLVLLPNFQLYSWSGWPTQPFFTPRHVDQALGTKSNVIILPYIWSGPGMAWQLDAGMRFTQSGGYTGFTPYTQSNFAVLGELSTGVIEPSFGNDLAAFCATHRVDDILIGPDTPVSLAAAIAAQGWPQHIDQGIDVVKVPPPSALNYYYIVGDYWPSVAPQNWMGRQVRIVTHGLPMVLTLMGTLLPISGPVQMTMTSQSGQVVYSVIKTNVQVIHIPANAVLTLAANRTFVPDKVLHNGDVRNLSVLISLEKN